jgi:hypothetical protein
MSGNNFKIKGKIDNRLELTEREINIINITLIGDFLQGDKSDLKILMVFP